MRLVLEVPDSQARHWIQRLKEQGLTLVTPTPAEVAALEAEEAESPTIPRAVAEDLRQAIAEVKAARNGGPPLLTMEQLFASLDEPDDDEADEA